MAPITEATTPETATSFSILPVPPQASTTPQPEPIQTSDLFSIHPIAGKGYGVVATTRISPGTTIFREGLVMRISISANLLTEGHLAIAFSKISRSDQTAVFALHEGEINTSNAHSTKLMRIFKANTFGNGTACWLHPIISRFNHSCVANATTIEDEDGLGNEVQVIAEKVIEEGEEICFSYNNEMYEITTAQQRSVLLQKQYGFACDCKACADPEFQPLSDVRRQLTKELKSRLYGLQTSDFSWLGTLDAESVSLEKLLEEKVWVKNVPLERQLPAHERMAYHLMLGKLREAEGMPTSSYVQNYWHAAEALLEQMLAMKDVAVLPWARKIRELMERAIELMDEVRSPYDDDPQMLRAAWKNMQGRPVIRVALSFLEGDLKAKFRQRQDSYDQEPFAIHVTKGTGELTLLWEEECNRLLCRNDWPISPASQDDELLQEAYEASSKASKVKGKVKEYSGTFKVLGAALTCAAPVAAYWVMR